MLFFVFSVIYISSYYYFICPGVVNAYSDGTTIYMPVWSTGQKEGESAVDSILYRPMIAAERLFFIEKYYVVSPISEKTINDLKKEFGW
jgi:hypothetical protein